MADRGAVVESLPDVPATEAVRAVLHERVVQVLVEVHHPWSPARVGPAGLKQINVGFKGVVWKTFLLGVHGSRHGLFLVIL